MSNTATVSYKWSLKGKQPIIECKQAQSGNPNQIAKQHCMVLQIALGVEHSPEIRFQLYKFTAGWLKMQESPAHASLIPEPVYVLFFQPEKFCYFLGPLLIFPEYVLKIGDCALYGNPGGSVGLFSNLPCYFLSFQVALVCHPYLQQLCSWLVGNKLVVLFLF